MVIEAKCPDCGHAQSSIVGNEEMRLRNCIANLKEDLRTERDRLEFEDRLCDLSQMRTEIHRSRLTFLLSGIPASLDDNADPALSLKGIVRRGQYMREELMREEEGT